MELTKKQRSWVCAIPQPGWGGCTLTDYIAAIGDRPDANGTDQEVAEVLDSLVASGHAQTVPVENSEPPRWELTDDGHDALIAPIDPAEGATAAEVMLELQPGRVVSKANAEAG